MQLLPFHIFIRDGFQVFIASQITLDKWDRHGVSSLNVIVNHLTSTAKFCDASELYKRKKPVDWSHEMRKLGPNFS